MTPADINRLESEVPPVELPLEWSEPGGLYMKGFQVATDEYAALKRGEAKPHDPMNPDLKSHQYCQGFKEGMNRAINADPEMSREEVYVKPLDERAAPLYDLPAGYIRESVPEPIDLVSEGKAIAALLETLAALPDRSKGRVLGAVIDLAQTAGPFVRSGLFQDLPTNRSAENLRRLHETQGAVREEGDESP